MSEIPPENTAHETSAHQLPLVESQPALPPVDESPGGRTISYIFDGGSSPDIENISSFEFSSKKREKYRILGNSASGKSLQPRGGLKQELPRSIFSSVISLPKIRQVESHKKVVQQYKSNPPKTFDLPCYRGYIVKDNFDQMAAIRESKKRKLCDQVDSRYRLKDPLKQGFHLTWALSRRIEHQLGVKELDMKNYENFKVEANAKTEHDYLKTCVDVSGDEDPYDKEEKEQIGANAIKRYNYHYKIIEKVESENLAVKMKNSLYTNVLSGISKKRLMPLKMGVVKVAGNPKEINNK